MKHFLLALLLIPTIAAGQNLPVGTAANAVRKDLGGSWTGRLFWLPATDTTTANNLMVSTYPSLNRAGSAIVQAGVVYIHNGTKWNQQVNSDLLAAWTAAITGNHYTKAQADARFQLQSNMGLYAKNVHLDSVMIQFAEFAGQTFATKEEVPKLEAGRGVVIAPVADTTWVMADTAVMMTAWRAQQTISRIDSTNAAQQAAISARLAFDEAEALYQPKGPYLTYEQDGSVTNELQTLSVMDGRLYISAGNNVALPVTDTTSLSNRINGKQAAGAYLTSESDPVWSAAASGYRTKTQNDGLYYSISNPAGYISGISWAGVTGKPSFATVATTGQYGDLIGQPVLFSGAYNDLTGKPTIPTNTNQLTNGAGYLTTVPAQTWASITGKPSFAAVATSGAYADLTGTPTIPDVSGKLNISDTTGKWKPASYTAPTYTAGSGIAITGGVISNTYTIPAPAFSTPTRALNTGFQPSATRAALVSYSVTLTTAISLLNLNSSATAFLEISPNNSTWTTINSAGITRTLSVAITLGINETSYYNLQCAVPAGYYVRIRTVTAGGGTATYGSGQETLIN